MAMTGMLSVPKIIGAVKEVPFCNSLPGGRSTYNGGSLSVPSLPTKGVNGPCVSL